MSDAEWVVGIDVSKAILDVAILPTNETFQVGNDKAGWAALIKRLKARKVKVVGLEPSGGYERNVVKALRKADLPVRSYPPLGSSPTTFTFRAFNRLISAAQPALSLPTWKVSFVGKIATSRIALDTSIPTTHSASLILTLPALRAGSCPLQLFGF